MRDPRGISPKDVYTVKVAEREGWVVLKIDATPVCAEATGGLQLVFVASDTQAWTLLLTRRHSAHYDQVNDEVLDIYDTYPAWLKAGENDWSEPPGRLLDMFAPEIAAFLAELRLRGMWPI